MYHCTFFCCIILYYIALYHIFEKQQFVFYCKVKQCRSSFCSRWAGLQCSNRASRGGVGMQLTFTALLSLLRLKYIMAQFRVKVLLLTKCGQTISITCFQCPYTTTQRQETSHLKTQGRQLVNYIKYRVYQAMDSVAYHTDVMNQPLYTLSEIHQLLFSVYILKLLPQM